MFPMMVTISEGRWSKGERDVVSGIEREGVVLVAGLAGYDAIVGDVEGIVRNVSRMTAAAA